MIDMSAARKIVEATHNKARFFHIFLGMILEHVRAVNVYTSHIPILYLWKVAALIQILHHLTVPTTCYSNVSHLDILQLI